VPLNIFRANALHKPLPKHISCDFFWVAQFFRLVIRHETVTLPLVLKDFRN
jgi:hypothetical protein